MDDIKYDLLISCVESDRNWVYENLINVLSQVGVRFVLHIIPYPVNRPNYEILNQYIPNYISTFESYFSLSQYTLLILSSAYINNHISSRISMMALDRAVETEKWNVIPVITENIELPSYLSMLKGINLVNLSDVHEQIEALGSTLKIISPKLQSPYPNAILRDISINDAYFKDVIIALSKSFNVDISIDIIDHILDEGRLLLDITGLDSKNIDINQMIQAVLQEMWIIMPRRYVRFSLYEEIYHNDKDIIARSIRIHTNSLLGELDDDRKQLMAQLFSLVVNVLPAGLFEIKEVPLQYIKERIKSSELDEVINLLVLRNILLIKTNKLSAKFVTVKHKVLVSIWQELHQLMVGGTDTWKLWKLKK